MNMHIVYSLSAFVDRGAYLSISTHVKGTFGYSSRRAELCKCRPEILTCDLDILFETFVDISLSFFFNFEL